MKQVKQTPTQTMEAYKDKQDDILPLSNLQTDENTTGSEEVNTTFYQDFFGVSSEDLPVKQPLCDDNVRKPAEKMEETNPIFRSNSGSFRYMRFKMGSRTGTWRSKSLSVMASKSKSRWQVFMHGFGSGRFPTKMDLIDIKTRQLRSRSMMSKGSQNGDDVGREDSGGRRSSGKKVWWRLVDVLGCGGGYETNTIVVV